MTGVLCRDALWALAAMVLPTVLLRPSRREPAAERLRLTVLTVEFSNPGLSPSHWVLTLHPDGSGHFAVDGGASGSRSPGQMRIPDVNRDVQLSPRLRPTPLQTAQRHAWFNDACESHIR